MWHLHSNLRYNIASIDKQKKYYHPSSNSIAKHIYVPDLVPSIGLKKKWNVINEKQQPTAAIDAPTPLGDY